MDDTPPAAFTAISILYDCEYIAALAYDPSRSPAIFVERIYGEAHVPEFITFFIEHLDEIHDVLTDDTLGHWSLCARDTGRGIYDTLFYEFDEHWVIDAERFSASTY